MFRLLLTVLALATGLIGMVEPAQAARAATSVERMSEAGQCAPARDAAAMRFAGAFALPALQRAVQAPLAPAISAIRVPTVWLRIDRARE